MAVIKSAKSDRLLKDAIVLDMGDLVQQAQHILGGARAEAARIIEQAHAQAKRLTTSAEEQGHAQGLERGLQEGREAGEKAGRQAAMQEYSEQLQSVVQHWTRALAEWENDRARMHHEAREDVIRFAFSLGQRIVHRLVQTDAGIVRDQVAAALALLSRPTAVEIVVNPADRAILDSALPGLLGNIASCKHARVHEDQSLARGGCIVKSAAGRIDATIGTQLDRIAELLVPQITDSMTGSADPHIGEQTTDDGAQPST